MLTTMISLGLLALASEPKTLDAEPSTSERPASEPRPEPRIRGAIGLEGELAPATTIDVGEVAVPTPSLALTLDVRRRWGLQLLAGVGWASARTGSPVESMERRLGVHGSLRALWWPLRWDRGRVGVVGQVGYRGTLGREEAGAQRRTLRRHGLVAGAGLRPELFVAPRLSLHTQLGVAYAFGSDATTRIEHAVVFAGGVVGQAGLSIWF